MELKQIIHIVTHHCDFGHPETFLTGLLFSDRVQYGLMSIIVLIIDTKGN